MVIWREKRLKMAYDFVIVKQKPLDPGLRRGDVCKVNQAIF
jgi:hypothetical protein